MRLAIAVFALALAAPVAAQDVDMDTLVKGINDRIGDQGDGASVESSKLARDMTNMVAPQWGVAVEDEQGKTIDVFGQVPYFVTDAGAVQVPGYEVPPGAFLKVVPTAEWENRVAQVALKDSPIFAPITQIPAAMEEATDFIVTSLCATKARPSEIELSLVVSASGSILVAEAGTEAGSSVTWNLYEDLCPRYGFRD